MQLLECSPELLPNEQLSRLGNAVGRATDPANMNGVSPYHQTFWYELGKDPCNLVEEAVQKYFLPEIDATVRERAVGVEWWLGRLTAPYAENFEFGVHRDFGENPQTGALESPMLSSVFFLTTAPDGLLTVFPGQPDLQSKEKVHVFPSANTYARFPGNLWHAVLSRKEVLGEPGPASGAPRVTILVNWWPYRPSSEATAPMRLVAADYDGTVYEELRI
ncbi:hypothetical protein ACWGJ2_23240 [Streptomyces sp. NPDC054796]